MELYSKQVYNKNIILLRNCIIRRVSLIFKLLDKLEFVGDIYDGSLGWIF
jgi:hypothetical protein